MRVLGRIVIDLIGYIVAALAASLTFQVLLSPQFGLAASNGNEIASAVMLFTVPLAAIVIAAVAFVPAAVAIFIAEAWPFRSWLYFTIVAGALGFVSAAGFSSEALDTFFDMGADLQIFPPGISVGDASFAGIAIAAGIVAGFAYWLIAGRSSGSWRTTSPAPSES